MGDVNLSISKEVVQPIIESKINAAVAEALSGQQSIVESVVAKVLSDKVECNTGKPSRYGSSSDIPFIQYLCSNAIREAATQAIRNYISSSNERIVAEIEKILQKRSKTIAINLVNSFIKAVESDYSLKVDVSAITKDRY